MPVGEWVAQAICFVEVADPTARDAWTSGNPPILWAGQTTLRRKVKVVETPATLVELVDKSELTDAIEKSMAIKSARFNAALGTFYLTIAVRRPPENIACGVFARSGGKEQHVLDLVVEQGREFEQSIWFHPQPPSGTIELVFRSNPALARRTVNILKMWKGEIVLKNVGMKDGNE